MSQRKDMSFAPVDLNYTVMHVMKICENTFDKKIELVAELYDMKAMVMADGAQLEQALLNLCDNAAQAMTIMRNAGEEGGVLTVTISKAFADTNFKMQHPEAVEHSYWVISVSDTGIGMDQETMNKIFDPFFSTKGKEESTGLGLTLVHDVVRKHNGFIEVESGKGVGTAFDIFIPEYVAGKETVEEETAEEETAETSEHAP